LAVWLSHGLEVSLWPWDFFLACDCVKCLVLKGLVDGQAYFDESMKYIFTYLQNVIGNLPAMSYLALVASKQGTPTITPRQMTTKLDRLKRDAESLEREIDNQIEFMESLPDWTDDYEFASRHLDGLMQALSEVSDSIEDLKFSK
jgi:hypothetical protein